MYLSRIEINPRRAKTRRALASPQILHAAIEACFPALGRTGSRNLWRIDSLNRALCLLLQSGSRPDFTHIIEQFGWMGQTWETREYAGFLSRLQNDAVWAFRLRANPTHSVNAEDTGAENLSRGKVTAYATADAQLLWLAKRAPKCGFAIERDSAGALILEVTQSETNRFARQGKTVTINAVAFEGVLRILDAESLANAMKNGIGRAKAYGCGLLTLAPRIGADEET